MEECMSLGVLTKLPETSHLLEGSFPTFLAICKLPWRIIDGKILK